MSPWWKRVTFNVTIVSLLGATFGILVGFAVVVLTDLPQVEALERYQPKGVTSLRDIRGNVVHEFFYERRIPVSSSNIPLLVRKAFLASEDWRFYEHFGLDVQGLFRATVKNIMKRKYAEGASTITQQLAKVLFLTPEKTLARKFKEALLALQIERRYSKDEILGLYLNQIYLGSGCYGVEAATRTYFNKSIQEVNIAETAMLAALPKAPSSYSPFRNPELARKRRNLVLQSMYERNLISRAEWDQAQEEPLPEKPSSDDRIDSYFSAHILKLLSEKIGEDQVYRGRLTVQTTLDLELQRTAEEAVRKGIAAYAQRHQIAEDDVEKLPQAAFLAVDTSNGEIRAMVGGRSFAESQFNRATQALRQPGSSFKPILFSAALEKGYTQSSLLADEPISFEHKTAGKWEPQNYDKKYMGEIPLRIALEKSKNVVAVRLLQGIGISALKQMTNRLGILSPIAPNLSSALGSSSLKLSELAKAYAVFASGGIRHHLKAIRSVRTESGSDLWHAPPPSEPVLDPSIAYVMTDMLRGVIRSGTGQFAANLPCALAGKTGTTDEYIDALFVGYSSKLVGVSWMGFDDRKSLGFGETGARAAGRVWKDFFTAACHQSAPEFVPPPGVMLVDVDHSSGQIPSRYCTDITTEAFVAGSLPAEICSEETIPQL